MAQKVAKQKNDPGLGIEFEVLLPAYLCLNLLENEEVEDFSIESNAEGFGNVDDLIIRIKKRDQEELLFALQLKHADNADARLYPNTFWSEDITKKGNFKLEKYCETFAKFDEERRKYCIILFTNRRFDAEKVKEVQNFTMEQNDNCKGKAYFDTSPGKSIYKFSLNDASRISSNLLTKNDFQMFFEKFSLYTSQCSSRNLDKNIREKLSNHYSGNKSSANDYMDFFRSWHKNEFTNKKLTKAIVQMQMIRILLSNCIQHRFSITKPDADCQKSEILKEVIHSFDIIAIEAPDLSKVDENDDVDDSNTLNLAKDLNIVKKDANILTPEEHYDLLIYTGQTPAVLIWNETTKKLIFAVLSKILRKSCKIPMTMIMCGKNIDLSELSMFRVFNNLHDLLVNDKNLFFKVLENFKISLQGRENILLKQLIVEEVSQFITTDDLLKSYNDKLTIGMRNEIVIEHYVPRVLATICLPFKFIIQLTKDLLVINCGDELERVKEKLQENTTKDIFYIEDFLYTIETEDLKKDLESAIILSTSEVELEIFRKFKGNLHFLKLVDEDSFQWISSRGDLHKLKRGNKYGIKEVKEEAVCDIFKKNNVNVICAEPGMGKSVLMEALKKYTPSDHWSVKIDFRECFQMLEAFSKSQDWEEAFYKQVFEKNEDTRRRFKDLLLKQKKVFIFFDGLDELQSIHVETAIKFVETLVSRGFKIWISSRRNFQELLETRFNVFSLNIQEFSEDAQRNYIKNRLSSFHELEKIQEITQKIFDNAEIFNNSKILGIPLQLSMLTEILIQNKDLAKEFNKKIFVMTAMFQSFFESKLKHYLLKETSNIGRLQEDYMNFRSYFEIAGLKSCLDESFYETLNITESKEYRNCIESDPSKLGIITRINEDRVPVFQHNTYGEYFAACYFAENYETINLSRLFEPKYNNIRLMFDIKLAQDSLPHLAVIYKDLNRLKTLQDVNCKDKGGRTPLHLACCYGEKFPLLEVKNGVIKDSPSDGIAKKNLEVNIEIIKFLRNTKIDLFAKDKVFEWNSLQYSEVTMNLAAIDILIGDKVADLVGLKKSIGKYLIKNYKPLTYYASKFNFKNLFKMLKKLVIGKQINIFKRLHFREFLKLKTESDENLLHVAVENRSREMVKLLLDEGIALNIVDTYGRTAFDIAFLVKDKEIQQILASKGATTNCLEKYEKNPLQWAAKNNYIKIIKSILDKTDIDINNGDHNKWTALHHAVRNGHLEIITYLLDSGADIEARTKCENTPLYLGINYGQIEAINLLLTKGAANDMIRNNGDKPLHVAIIANQEEALKLLLKKNLNINATNDAKQTALHVAVKNNKIDAVKLLLAEEKTYIECRDYQGNTPLHLAAASLEIFQLLLEKGADAHAVNNFGENVLHLLAKYQNHGIFDFACKFLTKEKFDIENKDNEGNTPLHIAAKSACLEMFQLLLVRGADLNAVNNCGETVLHLSVIDSSHSEILDFALKSPAIKVNVRNFKRDTALHTAIRCRNLEAVELLLTHEEIDIESGNYEGNTPIIIAAMFSSLQMLHLLLEKGADVNATSDSGETVLHLLMQYHNKERFDLIFKLSTTKINVNVKNFEGETILHNAILHYNVEFFELLLTHEEIDIESRNNKGNTPLLVAAKFYNLKAFHWLLEKGADVNAINDSGDTVLHLLVQRRNKEVFDLVCKLLSTSKINVNVKNFKGETILHKAFRYKNIEVVEYLLTREEIDADCKDNQGSTPLQFYIKFGHISTVLDERS